MGRPQAARCPGHFPRSFLFCLGRGANPAPRPLPSGALPRPRLLVRGAPQEPPRLWALLGRPPPGVNSRRCPWPLPGPPRCWEADPCCRSALLLPQAGQAWGFRGADLARSKTPKSLPAGGQAPKLPCLRGKDPRFFPFPTPYGPRGAVLRELWRGRGELTPCGTCKSRRAQGERRKKMFLWGPQACPGPSAPMPATEQQEDFTLLLGLIKV